MSDENLDYERLARLNVCVIDALSQDVEACLMQNDTKSLTEALRASGLALSNISKLRTLQKRETVEEEDDGVEELLKVAREKAAALHGKAKA
jgi:hypothetical protein